MTWRLSSTPLLINLLQAASAGCCLTPPHCWPPASYRLLLPRIYHTPSALRLHHPYRKSPSNLQHRVSVSGISGVFCPPNLKSGEIFSTELPSRTKKLLMPSSASDRFHPLSCLLPVSARVNTPSVLKQAHENAVISYRSRSHQVGLQKICSRCGQIVTGFNWQSPQWCWCSWIVWMTKKKKKWLPEVMRRTKRILCDVYIQHLLLKRLK